MKFKKEDLGLYFAFVLVGGGLGLLAGALITNWLEKKARKELAEEGLTLNEKAQQEWNKEAQEIIEEEGYMEISEVESTVSTWHVVPEQEEEIDEKPERERRPQRPNRSDYTEEEIAEFIEVYSPSQIQLEMLRNKMMTMDQIASVIEREEEAQNSDPTNYAGQYYEEEEEDEEFELEEIEEIVKELGVVDDRFHILTGPPEDFPDRIFKDIQWDPEDDSFYTLRRGQPINHDIRTGIGFDTWGIVEPLFDNGVNDIYVVDNDRNIYYKFHKLIGDSLGLGEVDPADDGLD
jgi:hypothetical protein